MGSFMSSIMADYAANYVILEALAHFLESVSNNVFGSFLTKETDIYVQKHQIVR